MQEINLFIKIANDLYIYFSFFQLHLRRLDFHISKSAIIYQMMMHQSIPSFFSPFSSLFALSTKELQQSSRSMERDDLIFFFGTESSLMRKIKKIRIEKKKKKADILKEKKIIVKTSKNIL